MAEAPIFEFSEKELTDIQAHVAKYPEARSAVMPALWMAQEKFGWLSPDAIRLVATTLSLPYSHVYGVASFYTMYFKEKVPQHLIEVCTCFSCSVTGGPEMLDFVRNRIEADAKGIGKEGTIWCRAAECLGACDTAPVAQITNRRYVHNLTEESMGQLIDRLNQGEEIEFSSVPLKDQTKFD